MKHPDDEEGVEAKIQGFIERDRKATRIRMGDTVSANVPLSPPQFENVSNSTLNSRNYVTSMAHTRNFSPPAAIFREQVRRTEQHLHTILKRTQKNLQAKATTSNTRKAAKNLVKEFRRETNILLREAKRQADHLEKAARRRISAEREQAYEKMKEQAKKNLQKLTGVVPTQSETRRLAKARRNSAGRKTVNASKFVNARAKKPGSLKNSNSMKSNSMYSDPVSINSNY
jgi:polyhydroxyalkanoate synthesis regulator phasin